MMEGSSLFHGDMYGILSVCRCVLELQGSSCALQIRQTFTFICIWYACQTSPVLLSLVKMYPCHVFYNIGI